MTKDQLADLFKPHGEIIQSKILVDQYTGTSKGAGFILFRWFQSPFFVNLESEWRGWTHKNCLKTQSTIWGFDNDHKSTIFYDFIRNLDHRVTHSRPLSCDNPSFRFPMFLSFVLFVSSFRLTSLERAKIFKTLWKMAQYGYLELSSVSAVQKQNY